MGELPYVLIGTVEQIVEQLLRMRERWGISYYVVRNLRAFAPVVRLAHELAGTLTAEEDDAGT